MDNLAGPYPWIRDDPVAYVDAYRHVVARTRSRAENLVFVWSPAGNEGCERYWPGDDYVDVVGLSILCFPDWELRTYGHIRGFDEMFSEKYARVERFRHVVLVAEFGVAGTDGLQREWLRSAFARFGAYPLLRSVVLYFSRDVDDAWGADLPTPDWRFRLSILEEARQARAKSDTE
jgi:endoglucanase